ncbi:hypothetical protein [Clavibacter tessellarius]|uniref:hypothetical protein n=1 Tax=Clavibacter tessellarius TaxID=31965 RepID=UPI00325688BE
MQTTDEAPGWMRTNPLGVCSAPGRPEKVVAPWTQSAVVATGPRRSDSSPGKAEFDEVPRVEMATSKATVPVFLAVKAATFPCPGRSDAVSSATCCVMTRPLDPLVTLAGCVLAAPFQSA